MVQRILPQGWGAYGDTRVSPAQKQSIITSVNAGATLAETQSALQDAGIGLRRQAISEVRRQQLGKEVRGLAFRRIRPNYRPNINRIAKTRFNLATRFSYWGNVETTVRSTGERFTVSVNFGSNELLTRGQIDDELAAIAATAITKYDLDADKPFITDILEKVVNV